MSGEIVRFPRSDGIDHRLLSVEPGLFQGSCLTGFDGDIQKQFGIQTILSITTKTVPIVKNTTRWWFCKEDGEPWNSDQVDFILDFSRFAKSRIALIHCDHGVSRSGAGIVLCLMDRHNLSRTEAFQLLKGIDPSARIHEKVFDSLPERL